MKSICSFLKGIHYSNVWAYNILTYLKLGRNFNLRFEIAAEYVNHGNSVLDVCSGAGELKKFLPGANRYLSIEASPQFITQLSIKEIKHLKQNLHHGINANSFKADVLIMVISLCQFRNTSMHSLLEDFKKMAQKVVIVEDVLVKKRKKGSLVQKTSNYLAAVDYFQPIELFTVDEFRTVLCQHQYQFKRHDPRYSVGVYFNGKN